MELLLVKEKTFSFYPREASVKSRVMSRAFCRRTGRDAALQALNGLPRQAGSRSKALALLAVASQWWFVCALTGGRRYCLRRVFYQDAYGVQGIHQFKRHAFSKNMLLLVFLGYQRNFFNLLCFLYGILINSRVDNCIIIRPASVIILDVLFS